MCFSSAVASSNTSERVSTRSLNLETGTYHGLNPTGGRMLEVLEREERVRDAIASLADEYGTEQSRVEEDVCDFCNDLLERGLIEIHLNGRH